MLKKRQSSGRNQSKDRQSATDNRRGLEEYEFSIVTVMQVSCVSLVVLVEGTIAKARGASTHVRKGSSPVWARITGKPQFSSQGCLRPE